MTCVVPRCPSASRRDILIEDQVRLCREQAGCEGFSADEIPSHL